MLPLKRIYKILILVFAICLTLTGCLNSNDANLKEVDRMKPKGEGTLNLSSYTPDTLNPLATEYSCIRDILYLSYEGLFIVNEDLTVRGVLATDYKVSDKNTHYNIKLKKGVKFHDGTEFTSKDVIATFDYIRLYGGYYLDNIENIQSYKADGNYGVDIYLKSSANNFVANLDFPILKAGLGAGDFGTPNSKFDLNGTGRYKFSKINAYESLVLAKNNSWHGKTQVYIPEVLIRYVNDNDSIVYAFDSGETDMITTDRARWGEYSYKVSHNIYELTTTKYVFAGFNTVNGAFSDVQLRRCIADLIDKENIADTLMFSHATPAICPITAKAHFYRNNTDKKYETDKDYIREKKLKTYILYNEEDKQKEDVAKYLEKVLEEMGAKIELTKVDYETYLNKIQSGDYGIYIGKVDIKRDCDLGFMFAKAANIGGEVSVVNPDESDNPNNMNILPFNTGENSLGKICNYSSAALDDVINNINSAKDGESLSVAYNNLCGIYKEDVPQIPLYHINDAILVSTRIKGKVVPNLTNFYADIGEIYIN